MKNNKTPHNQDGQQPTRSAKETEERLEEKEHEEQRSPANSDCEHVSDPFVRCLTCW